MRYLIALPILILMKIEEKLLLRIAKRRLDRPQKRVRRYVVKTL